MIRNLLLSIFLLPSLALAIDYEANVKALSPTGWWKGYYGNTLHSDTSIATIGDFSGNSRTFSQGTGGLRAFPTRQDSNQNLIAYNEQFNLWTDSNITVTADSVVNPLNSTVNADTLLVTAGGGFRYLATTPHICKNGEVYTASVYSKSDTAPYAAIRFFDGGTVTKYAYVKFADGTCTSDAGATCSVSDAGSGWYRISVIATSTYAGVGSGNILVCPGASGAPGASCGGNNGLSAYFYGAQLEKASSPGPYVSNTRVTLQYPGVSGIPALHFDGTNDYYTSTATLGEVVGASAKTVYAVIRASSTASSGTIFGDNAVDDFRIQVNGITGFTSIRNRDAGGEDTCNGITAISTTTPSIIVATHDGTNLRLYKNNVLENTCPSNATGLVTRPLILGGYSGAGNDFAGDIVEVIVFNAVHTLAQQQTVYDYLTWVLNNPWKRVEVTP